MGYELNVIKDARQLYFKINKLIKQYPEHKYTLNQQIIRAAVSVGSNIIEGQRRSKKEFARFISISIGSCCEVQFQSSLYSVDTTEIIKYCDRIIGQLVNLKKNL